MLDAAWRVEAGRAALRELGPRELWRLGADYRTHYGSSLLRPRELAGWRTSAGTSNRGAPALTSLTPCLRSIEHGGTQR